MENPYELLYISHSGDEWSLQALFDLYARDISGYINTLTKKYTPLKIYREDLMQEAYISLYSATMTYREDCGCSFKTFMMVVIRHRIWNIMRHYCATSHVPMHELLSTEQFIRDTEATYDALRSTDVLCEPEYLLHFKLIQEEVDKVIESLDELDKEVLNAWLNDESYKEASTRLGISYKKYDGRLQKVRKRIRQAVYGMDHKG